MRCLLLCSALLPLRLASCQSSSTQMGAPAEGMGYATSCTHNAWALYNNVAGLSGLPRARAALSGDRSPLPGANRIAGLVAIPTSIGVPALGVFQFGDDFYREQMVSGGFANQFGLAALGVGLDVVQYRIEGLGTRTRLRVNFGGIVDLSTVMHVGAYLTNLNGARLSADDDEPLPVTAALGLAVTPSAPFVIATEIGKDLAYPLTWRTGISYFPSKRLWFRSGFNVGPDALFLGAGFALPFMELDMAIQFDDRRGLDSQASFVIPFGAQ